MNKTFVIARRELAERSFVLFGAVVVAFAPLLALLGPGRANRKMEAVSLISIGLAVNFVLGLSLALGTSIVGRELRERRLSFYFSRPVSATQLWFGKLLAAIVLVGLCGAIMLTAPLVFYPTATLAGWSIPLRAGLSALAGGALALMLLMHSAVTVLRARSPWLLLDGLIAVLFLAGAAIAILPLVVHGAYLLFSFVIPGLVALVFVAIIAAGRSQLARGGIDIEAQHRAFSRTLWSITGAGVLAALLLTSWVRNVGIHDLKQPFVNGSGALLTVRGQAVHRGGYRAVFVLDPKSGKSMEIGSPDFMETGTSPTAIALKVWRPTEVFRGVFNGPGPAELRVVRKRGNTLERIDTSIEVPLRGKLAISDDGSRVAVGTGSLAVFNVDDGKLISAVRLPAPGNVYTTLRFLPSGVVRVEQSRRGEIGGTAWCGVSDFDPRTRVLREIFSRLIKGTSIEAISDPDGSKLWVSQEEGIGETMRRTMVDVASGRESTLEAPPGMTASRGLVLGDGSLACLAMTARRGQHNDVSLLAETSEGKLLRSTPVGEGSRVRLGGEVAPGIVVLSLSNTGVQGSTLAVNVGTGQIVRRIDGILLPGAYGRQFAPFFVGGETIVRKVDSIVAWNPVSGAIRKVL